jgi:hypothetical protein
MNSPAERAAQPSSQTEPMIRCASAEIRLYDGTPRLGGGHLERDSGFRLHDFAKRIGGLRHSALLLDWCAREMYIYRFARGMVHQRQSLVLA